ncbi:MAG: threonine--tRNA ligase [Candidatus Njordarchaeota archaeon]
MLIWHCDKFKYKPIKKAIKSAEDIPLEEQSYEDILVIFVSVEVSDDIGMVDYLAKEIYSLTKDVKAKRVLLYPYAHLSSNLASPELAQEIINATYEKLKGFDIDVYVAPFGYYKQFTASIKGHPLAERSRIITREEIIKERKKGKKRYVIVFPSGKEVEPSNEILKDLGYEFKCLVEKEALGKASPEKKHEMLTFLKRFGFEWEPRSDHGHQRMGPHAALIFDLVVDYSELVIRSTGLPIYKIKGTAFFNMSDRAVREHADLYGDRLYKIKTDKGTFVLRYAACHQQFSMLGDWYISYRNLPFGIFEIADSYRYEQSGEVELAFRLRRFWMPDFHIIVKDEEKAKEMLLKVHDRIMEEAKKLDQNYELLVNVVSQEQYDRYREFIKSIAKKIDKPVLVAIYPSIGLSYYWTINIEYHIVDYIGRPREIGTVQIDVGNSERFGICYVDEKGEKKYPVIIHTAIIGTIERYVYMVFDAAMKKSKKGQKAMLPLWLAPVQVRVIPVNLEFLEYAEKIHSEISKNGIRADIDDTNRTLSRKILDAEKEWVPYIIIVGKKEMKESNITVRVRRTGEQKKMSVSDLVSIIKQEQAGYPWRDLYAPDRLSMRIRMIA